MLFVCILLTKCLTEKCGGSNESDYDPGNITDLARHGINYCNTPEHVRALY